MAENGTKAVSLDFIEDDNNEVFISVKEEPVMFVDEDGGGAWAEEQVPKPMEGLRENEPPPFLRKTFEMVDDAETESIISWSCTKDSFIVWDPHKLCTDLLPKYFKHNNFSSFVRQLNTYRFRKVNPDRWEFANEGFQQGKKNLLKYIQRRQKALLMQQRGAPVDSFDVEAELVKLRKEHNTFTTEMMELKQQYQTSLRDLAAIRECLRVTESKQRHMVVFMIKSLKNSMFLQRFIDRVKERRGHILKRRRLASDSISLDDEKNVEVEEELMIESEIQALSSDESGSCLQEMSSFVLWEKLMEDDMIYEEDEEAETEEHSVLVSELENLIAKPAKRMVELLA